MDSISSTARRDPVEVDLIDIVAAIWRARLLIAALVVAGLVTGIVWLNVATPSYTATMLLTPAPNDSSSSAGRLGGLGGLAAAAGISGLQADRPTRFDLFFEMARSQAVAEKLAADPKIMQTLFDDQWDATSRSWRPPAGAVARAKATVRRLIGRRQGWQPPTGQELQLRLEKVVKIRRESNTDPITYVTFDTRHRDFGPYLLQKLHAEADEAVRRRSLATSRGYIAYLERRLPEVRIVEQRQALATILSEQEKAVMIASSGLPFAAAQIEPPVVSQIPTKPEPLLTLVFGAGLGLLLGVGFALFRLGRG
ncbi:Wzz/FepE/Etk N-terminal domain-containing protein [Sandaracinobacteroides hominis]|uniref:Wzz/FepE/Etk N-terminal domain-containing protein n=1 Tax=Sandaracinobacteroides hominis TaxID=2780086 RepID=UPI0018F750F0|nr:Wzz/FepE/Etk N-terminal domain-containing protein [Sandaracinobacteroides hominis]